MTARAPGIHLYYICLRSYSVHMSMDAKYNRRWRREASKRHSLDAERDREMNPAQRTFC